MEHRGDEYRTHANYCRHMAEGTASPSVSTRVAAIPCNSAAQAQALLQELGERDSRH